MMDPPVITKPTSLPKPTGLRKPTTVQKTINIIPTDRLKPAINGIRNGGIQNNRMPLARDITNLIRTRSPEFSVDTARSRMKLRRSKSACDLREAFSRTNFKRTQPVLAPIPAKTAKIINSGKFNSVKSTASTVSTSATSAVATKPKMAAATTTLSKTNSTESKQPNNTRKKIPAYDYKARFLDLQERHKSLKEKYDEAKEQLVHLDQFEECQSELIKVKQDLKYSNTQLDCLQKQNTSQSKKISALTECLQKTQDELNVLKKKYELAIKEQNEMLSELKELREKSSNLEKNNTYLTKELDECKDQLFKANIERRELHNVVLDLRGNIRVFCRVRPPLDNEIERQLCGWNYLDETSLEIQSLELGKAKTCHSFSFDHVFHPRSTQEDVFDMVSPLIQSALDGYNVCIFAYGQTGSGKTFTMDGIDGNHGVIPRTVDLIFESVKNYKRLGWEYNIKVSFLEIYNENLYDLLSNEQKHMEIRMIKNNSNDIYVSNITEVFVDTANYLRELIQIAKMNRATASTIGNERSSRSHAVTRIELIGTHAIKNETSIGIINLVDLAGSESPKTSTRMNETKNINRSLSELTNVILALLQKQDHIPYRNSKLTHLLMPCLGGNSKTLMFINVSPFQDCFIESVKSLRFAASVNSCKMTKVRRNKFLNTSSSNSSSNSSATFN